MRPAGIWRAGERASGVAAHAVVAPRRDLACRGEGKRCRGTRLRRRKWETGVLRWICVVVLGMPEMQKGSFWYGEVKNL